MKLCNKCNTLLEIERHFFKDKSHKDGFSSTCKGCRKIYSKDYRQGADYKKQCAIYYKKGFQKHRQKRLEYSKQYYLKNKHKINKRVVKHQRNKRQYAKILSRWNRLTKEQQLFFENPFSLNTSD